jgi:hypothetical protein
MTIRRRGAWHTEAVMSEIFWDFQPGQRVMTVDKIPGTVVAVQDGAFPGQETYDVVLDNNLGGGSYGAGDLSDMSQRTAAEVVGTGIHLATEDYPELGTILADRPDPGKLSFAAAANGPWYHGTRHELAEGDVMEGGKFPSNQGDAQPGQHVYYTGRPDVAHEFAEAGYGPEHDPDAEPKVYQVEPVHGHEADPDEDSGFQSYRAPSVRVIRRHAVAEPPTQEEPGQVADQPATGSPESDDQPSACSYCGGTDFEGHADNGRVQQATCSTCGGTMSAHPGGQWTPELIGDPSNHPSVAVDPASGASNGGGQTGINDFIDFTSRVSTTAAAEPEDDAKTTPTKRAGFAGYVEAEKTNFANHGDNPDWDDEQAVGAHAGVHEFRGYSGRENNFAHWHDKGEITHVPLHGGNVYATQPRVTNRGVNAYLNDPQRKSGSGRANYPANDRPIFVHHGGNYYTLDGHHRTAAAMLRGDEHVEGHVYDADKHGFPEPEWSPISEHLPRSLEKYSALAGAYLGCGFDTDDETEALQHELNHHDDGFCSALGHQKTATQHTAARAFSWDEIGERHPHVYGDSEIHGEDAEEGDGQGIGYAANHLAHDRADDPGAEGSSAHSLNFHEKMVHPRHIDYSPSGSNDPRVQHAREGYQHHPEKMPPLVLVHRHGVYQVADGHHRAEAAASLDQPVKSYVAHSPYPDEPFANGEKGPFHGAEPEHSASSKDSRGPWQRHLVDEHGEIGGAELDQNPKYTKKRHDSLHPDCGFTKQATPDWCAHRHTGRCWYPGDKTVVAMPIPQDRGPCPWETSWQQQVCFGGETEYLTYDGYRTLKDTAGTSQLVLTSTGRWAEAEVKEFGVQRLYALTLRRNRQTKVIYTTAEHRWFIQPRKRDRDKWGVGGKRQIERTTTGDKGLKAGDKLSWTTQQSLLGRWYPNPTGVAHGIVFGDGSRESNSERLRGNSSFITLFGAKDEQLLPYFAGCRTKTMDVADNPHRNVGGVEVSGLPSFFKKRPDLNENAEYLYGWLAGYFAADGSVSEDGASILECASREVLEFVLAVCNRLTIATYDIREHVRQGCYGSGIIHDRNMAKHGRCDLEKESMIYRLGFVGKTLTPEFFLIKDHRDRFELRKDTHSPMCWTVVSVEESDREETVYCAVEPTTASFTLTGNILTGNCPISEPGPMALMQAKGSKRPTIQLPLRVVSSAQTAALEAHMAADDDDYRMQHQAPDADYGAPLHDVENMMPGFYQHPEHYNFGEEDFHTSSGVIQKAHHDPDKMVHIYRSLPAEHAHKGIRPGDWVSTSKDYARGEGRMPDSKDDYPVIRARVPAKHLHTEGNSVHEWGYNGPDTVHGMVVYKGGHNQEVRHDPQGEIKQVQRRPKADVPPKTGVQAAMVRLASAMSDALGPGSANR